MSVTDEKSNELIELLGIDTGLARVAREGLAKMSVEEIQKLIDEARALNLRLAKVLEAAPQHIKDGVARLRAL